MKTLLHLEMETPEQAHARHLHNAYLDGGYELEYPVMFFSRRDTHDCLLGNGKTFAVGARCSPIRWTNKSLLVRVTDKAGNWFAWIHS